MCMPGAAEDWCPVYALTCKGLGPGLAHRLLISVDALVYMQMCDGPVA
jgi:hypothetical protein